MNFFHSSSIKVSPEAKFAIPLPLRVKLLEMTSISATKSSRLDQNTNAASGDTIFIVVRVRWGQREKETDATFTHQLFRSESHCRSL